MLKRPLIGGVAGLLLVFASSGYSATLSVDSVKGAFCCDVKPGGDETVIYYDDDGDGLDEEVRWGNNPQGDARTSRSGLRFEGNAPPSFIATDSVLFLLGTLTHFNHPIDDPINQVDMDLFLEVSNGGSVNAGPFRFRYDVSETPNSDACNNLGTCTPVDDDIISIVPLTPLSNIFVSGGTTYILSIIGFSSDGGVTTTSSLRSPENSDNSAGLYAVFEVQPDEPVVPEPSTFLLAGGALAVLGIRSLRGRRSRS